MEAAPTNDDWGRYGPSPEVGPDEQARYTEVVEQARNQKVIMENRLAVDAVIAYCVNGRPPLSETVMNRVDGRDLLAKAYNSQQISTPAAKGRLDGLRRAVIERRREATLQRTAPVQQPTRSSSSRPLRSSRQNHRK